MPDSDSSAPLCSRSGNSNPLGKLTAEIKCWLPEETKDALTAMAVIGKQSVSEYVRDVLMRHCHGHLTMLRMNQNRADGSGGNGAESGE